jgi:hypothetical protein
MKRLLFAFFCCLCGILLAGGQPYPLGGCPEQYEWIADGGQYCEWIPVGNQSDPTWTFVCTPTGACWPVDEDSARRKKLAAPGSTVPLTPARRVWPFWGLFWRP